MIKNETNFILTEFTNKETKFEKIIFNIELSEIEAFIDPDENKKITIEIKETYFVNYIQKVILFLLKNLIGTIKEKYTDIILIFDDNEDCYHVKNFLDDKRNFIKKIKMSKLIQLLDSLQKEKYL